MIIYTSVNTRPTNSESTAGVSTAEYAQTISINIGYSAPLLDLKVLKYGHKDASYKLPAQRIALNKPTQIRTRSNP